MNKQSVLSDYSSLAKKSVFKKRKHNYFFHGNDYEIFPMDFSEGYYGNRCFRSENEPIKSCRYDHVSIWTVEPGLENTGSRLDVRINSICSESTSSANINKINQEFFDALKANSQTFAVMLQRSDFDDCVESEPIVYVRKYLASNRYVTYNWLAWLYAQYQDNGAIIAGILRIIGMIDIKEEVDCLLPIVIAGLNHPSSEAQEAAIMVAEVWRTKSCLKALESCTFSSDWIREYASAVVSELKSELGVC